MGALHCAAGLLQRSSDGGAGGNGLSSAGGRGGGSSRSATGGGPAGGFAGGMTGSMAGGTTGGMLGRGRPASGGGAASQQLGASPLGGYQFRNLQPARGGQRPAAAAAGNHGCPPSLLNLHRPAYAGELCPQPCAERKQTLWHTLASENVALPIRLPA